jgi:hypothetical protein
MTYVSTHDVFRAAMKERRNTYPFDHISAYKVRECKGNLQHGVKVVASIAQYQRTRPGYGRSGILVGCTEDDKAQRLKRTPPHYRA